MAGILSSPRRRRRLTWLAAGVAACLAAALVIVILPGTRGDVDDSFSNEPVQRVKVQKQVAVSSERRAEVNALFDAFVPAAVERRDPVAAYDLVTPAFRGGAARSVWKHGDLPVFPYQARGRAFHGWTVDTSYPTSMSVQLFLQPRDPQDGPVAYSVDLRRLHGRWLIDSFYPRAAYGSVATATTGASGGDVTAAAAPPEEKQAHAGLMWVLILGFFGLIVLTPLLIFAGPSLRRRFARRDGD